MASRIRVLGVMNGSTYLGGTFFNKLKQKAQIAGVQVPAELTGAKRWEYIWTHIPHHRLDWMEIYREPKNCSPKRSAFVQRVHSQGMAYRVKPARQAVQGFRNPPLTVDAGWWNPLDQVTTPVAIPNAVPEQALEQPLRFRFRTTAAVAGAQAIEW